MYNESNAAIANLTQKLLNQGNINWTQLAAQNPMNAAANAESAALAGNVAGQSNVPAGPNGPGFGESDYAAFLGANGGSNLGAAGAAAGANNGPPGAISYSGPSGAEMASAEFGPQYEALKRIMEGAQNRYNTGNKEIGNMYDALAAAISGQEGGIRAQYDATGQRIGNAYNQAIANAGNVYGGTASKLGEMMQRLGLGQSGQYVIDQTQGELAKNLGYLADNLSSRQAYNASSGQSALDFNRGTANNASLTGKNKQADLMRMFQQLQEQNALKELDLKSGEARATNQYNQSITESIGKQQQQSFENWLAQKKLEQSGADDELGWANYELNKSKFQNDVNAQGVQQQAAQQKALLGSPDAFGILSYYANSAYQGDPSAANTAVNDITNAYQSASGSLSQFLGKLVEGITDPIEAQRRKQLGTVWWQSVGNKPYPGTQA